MLNKKAQGLSINVIVIAAILVVILVVIILIFTKHTGNFSHKVSDCNVLGGKCMSKADCDGVIMNSDCSGAVTEVINKIKWVTAGSKAVCCMQVPK